MVDKLRVGLIGASPEGSWGTRAHLPALAALDGFEAVAVATRHRSTAEETAARFGIPHAFDDPRQLVEHPEVDVVSVCVRVPAHYELVTLALAAGKHVYCEWPLAKDTAEAEALLEAAQAAAVVHKIGLQARHAPALARARDLIADGRIGRVQACALNHSVDWMPLVPPSMTYLQDITTGAHMLSIPGGHSIDALCWLLGEFDELSATVKTLMPETRVAGSGEIVHRTSPDQVLVNGILESGAVAAVRIQGASGYGSGMQLEINGDKGDLVITMAPGGRGIQLGDLKLWQTTGPGELAEVAIPDSYYGVPTSINHGPPLNVARSYLALAEAIHQGAPVADFGSALVRHRTLDAVMASSSQGRRIRPGTV